MKMANKISLQSLCMMPISDKMCVIVSSKECVRCACDHSVQLDAPSIGFVCVCRKLSPNLRAGSQVFDLKSIYLIDDREGANVHLQSTSMLA